MTELNKSLVSDSHVPTSGPLVSAIIPTRNRPHLVLRAVQSALGQTYQNLEVVVVIDGPDAATSSSLDSINDDRLHVIRLQQSVGGAEARNVGVQAAHGEWIALLDDDDQWFPEKIELQVERALSSSLKFPIISSRFIARTPQVDYVWPRRLPFESEPIGEHLFCRTSMFQGEGMIQTSTILAQRSLLQMVPFARGLKRHQDWDWVIRAAKTSGVGVEICSESLAVYYIDEHRPTISNLDDWRHSLQWIRDRIGHS